MGHNIKVYCELCGDEQFVPPYSLEIKKFTSILNDGIPEYEERYTLCLICKEKVESYMKQLKDKKRCNKKDCTTCKDVETCKHNGPKDAVEG